MLWKFKHHIMQFFTFCRLKMNSVKNIHSKNSKNSMFLVKMFLGPAFEPIFVLFWSRIFLSFWGHIWWPRGHECFMKILIEPLVPHGWADRKVKFLITRPGWRCVTFKLGFDLFWPRHLSQMCMLPSFPTKGFNLTWFCECPGQCNRHRRWIECYNDGKAAQ